MNMCIVTTVDIVMLFRNSDLYGIILLCIYCFIFSIIFEGQFASELHTALQKNRVINKFRRNQGISFEMALSVE
jgi:hypothetical protein